MKKILLLATGGTIASKDSGGGLKPEIAGKELSLLAPELNSICGVCCKEILSLDSTNIQPEEWRIIAKEVCLGLTDFDGVVITHGTDTMAYTASILTFLLGRISKPVIFTGAQKPADAKGSDAPQNLADAFRAAASEVPGVFIVFGGKIIRGVRARKVHTYSFDAFDSINTEPAGLIAEDRITWSKGVKSTWPDICFEPDSPAGTDFDDNVFLLKLIPGTRPQVFETLVSMGYKGIVAESFGPGGLPHMRRDLVLAAKQAIKAGAAVVVTTQCERGGVDLSLYEVGVKALGAGVISAGDMTAEATVTKLMWVLAKTKDLNIVRKMMQANYFGEITERTDVPFKFNDVQAGGEI